MEMNLKNLNVLVTGASSGIGKAIAEAMGHSGARIAVHYNHHKKSAENIARQIGNNSSAFGADLENPDHCEKLFNNVVKEFGHIDVLVNNAGAVIMSPLENDTWIHDWDKTMAINLRAVGILCRLAIQHFKSRKSGRIINIASRAAFRGDTPELLAYAASKAGIVALSKSIARGFGKNGITCFVLAPGWVRTNRIKKSIKKYGENYILQDIALDKLTEPKDVASIAAFLAGGLADHATGTTIDINAASYVH
ncbi:MAG: SDR family oxidoreductase [Bacteroidia bacterium]|nr:SDR family oxidoreductase [Bacteroidia bacterium]